MASSELHIKDSYYFEVPKFLWRSDRQEMASFEDVWVRLDPDFQLWEAKRLYPEYAARRPNDIPGESELLREYVEWKHHDHANAGKPFSAFVEEGPSREWYDGKKSDPAFVAKWAEAKTKAGNLAEYREEYREDKSLQWSQDKISAYNRNLDGKILIPQFFGELRNLYQPASGFCVSKFMVIELFVGLILVILLSWLGKRVLGGGVPRGRLWNLLETFTLFIRDDVARPAIDHHHDEGDHGAHEGHGEAAAGTHAAHAQAAHGEPSHAHGTGTHGHGGDHASKSAHAAHAHEHEGDRYVPLLCSLFFFVLGCNLMGMLPWLGAPTGSWGATFGLAAITFFTVWLGGIKRFGLKGVFFLNHIPGMDVPLAIGLVIKPALYVIEVMGLMIKHAVLSIRLLANMVAGHVVLLGIMGIAFSLEGAASDWWTVSAIISVLGSTLLSILELAVAFIQAYIFTFLSALFIGSAVHEH